FLPSMDQAEAYDESAELATGSRFEQLLEHNVSTVRNARLLRVLDEILRDHAAEPLTVGVVFGAGHMAVVANHLSSQHGYIATSAEWLTVIDGRSLAGLAAVADNGAPAVRSAAMTSPNRSRVATGAKSANQT